MSYQKDTVSLLGEVITFGSQALKASLIGSTTATYSLANRAYFYEGQCFKGTPEFAVGDYFTRTVDGKTYFVATIQPEPLAADMVYIFAIQCNCTISILRYAGKTANSSGDLTDEWTTIYENVYAFRDFATRSGKQTNDGTVDQSIYTLILPHSYGLSENDRIVTKYSINGSYSDTAFKVESMGNSLVGLDNLGIDTVQMSLDIRFQ